jgi:hypothetical protein
MEDAMLLYIYWASVCLGLMALATEPYRQEQYARRAKPSRNAPQRGTATMPDRAADAQ